MKLNEPGRRKSSGMPGRGPNTPKGQAVGFRSHWRLDTTGPGTARSSHHHRVRGSSLLNRGVQTAEDRTQNQVNNNK